MCGCSAGDKEREDVWVSCAVLGEELSCVTFLLWQVGRDKVHPAISLVGYEEELQPAMEYVFGSTFVCDTLQNAKKVCLRGPLKRPLIVPLPA